MRNEKITPLYERLGHDKELDTRIAELEKTISSYEQSRK